MYRIYPPITKTQFEYLSSKVYSVCGIELKAGKEQLVQSRLTKRAAALGMGSLDEYFDLIEREPEGPELILMIDAITTNKTSFFREEEHFTFLRERIIPTLSSRTLRIWSAACSTGEEPYSIGMLLREELPDFASWDVKILATDISVSVLEKARSGEYREEILEPIPSKWRQRYFSKKSPDAFKISDEIRGMVRLARLNLMGPYPMKGPFDIIFCRNVMIYFDKPTQERLVRRFYELLRPGGYLLVGHSESLTGASHDFKYVQPATYQK